LQNSGILSPRPCDSFETEFPDTWFLSEIEVMFSLHTRLNIPIESGGEIPEGFEEVFPKSIPRRIQQTLPQDGDGNSPQFKQIRQLKRFLDVRGIHESETVVSPLDELFGLIECSIDISVFFEDFADWPRRHEVDETSLVGQVLVVEGQ
jgi:hypothetical protein